MSLPQHYPHNLRFWLVEQELSISVPIESLATSEGESIEVTLSASVIFQAPVQNAKMVLKWGSVDEDASITAQFPFVKMIVPDPVVDGGDVFVSVVILSPWGMDILAYSDASISVNGVQINTESIKTRSGMAFEQHGHGAMVRVESKLSLYYPN